MHVVCKLNIIGMYRFYERLEINHNPATPIILNIRPAKQNVREKTSWEFFGCAEGRKLVH